MKQELFFIESLSPLYEAVQGKELFADSKYFVDAVPNMPAAAILKLYEEKKNDAGFSLADFVKEYFVLPGENNSAYSSALKNIGVHLQDLWDELKRKPGATGGTLIHLPHEYIVPGGRFREIYYWDSYFTMLGLQVSGRVEMIESMVKNFAWLIHEFGFIPNGNRTYYLSRSQPPFFALMVNLLAEEKGDGVLLQYKTTLEKEYAYWMDGFNEVSPKQPAVKHVVLVADDVVMNRYWDEQESPRPEAYSEDVHLSSGSANAAAMYRDIRAAAASGWDFSSRWFADHENMDTIQTTSIIPVDLNCLLLFMEKMLQKMHMLSGSTTEAALFADKIQRRKRALHRFCWNEEEGCFFDYNFITQKQELHFNLSTVFPLFFNAVTNEQAAAVALLVKNKFLHPGGLITTIYKTGQQWDAPNGWAPLQWIAYRGLKNYRFNELAVSIKNNWLQNCEKVFAATGKMMEKYNVMDTNVAAGGGEYPNQDGFGWTNGVYLKMKNGD
ncbi:MAG: alpha,alpha-trehalase TreF [Ferruginibacter sp.]